MVPEIGIDPLKEFNQMLEVENNKMEDALYKETENKSTKTSPTQQTAAQNYIHMEEERRDYIRRKLKKRTEEEHYLKY